MRSDCRSRRGKRFRKSRRRSSAAAPIAECSSAARITSSTPSPTSCRASTTFKRASSAARRPNGVGKSATPMNGTPKIVSKPSPDTPLPAAIALLQSSSLPMLVQKGLERMIMAGELGAGAKLNEVALAERLGVSRGPVREAFRALEESGLVRQEKNRGVFVRQVSVEEADDIYEVRAIFDEWAGRRVPHTPSPPPVNQPNPLPHPM